MSKGGKLFKRVSEKRIVAQGRIGALSEWMVEGFDFRFEELVRPPGVRVIARTSDGQHVWLTREFRDEQGGRDLRAPGGKVYNRIDEYLDDYLSDSEPASAAIIAAACREFSEEVGLELREPVILGMSPAGATVHWPLYFVSGFTKEAADAAASVSQTLEHGEDIQVEPVPVNRLLDLVVSGEIGEERSAVWLLRALHGGVESA